MDGDIWLICCGERCVWQFEIIEYMDDSIALVQQEIQRIQGEISIAVKNSNDSTSSSERDHWRKKESDLRQEKNLNLSIKLSLLRNGTTGISLLPILHCSCQ
jgi:hypothetical protein